MADDNVNRFTKAFQSVGLGSPATPASSARRLTFAPAPPTSGESNVASASRFINVFGGVRVMYSPYVLVKLQSLPRRRARRQRENVRLKKRY